MNEKISVNDMLKDVNSTVTMLVYSIEQSNNMQFRDILIDYLNKYMNVQWDIYSKAKEKSYYIPAAPAGQADIEQVKTTISK
jgi:spore coat protein CotF